MTAQNTTPSGAEATHATTHQRSYTSGISDTSEEQDHEVVCEVLLPSPSLAQS